LQQECQRPLASKVFSDSAVFERVSHFKDVGIPNTLKDPFNRAAIADGTCRAVSDNAGDLAGYAFWHHPDRVDAVIAAIAALPSTSQPSNMTLAAKNPAFYRSACLGESNKTMTNEDYGLAVQKSSMQAWFRALCEPGFTDPAYQPQQIVLTAGFMCAITCDVNGKAYNGFYSDAVVSQTSAEAARDKLCDNMPGYEPDMFYQVHTFKDLRYAVGPIYNEPCQCNLEVSNVSP